MFILMLAPPLIATTIGHHNHHQVYIRFTFHDTSPENVVRYSVMVIIIGNEDGHRRSNPEWGSLHFHIAHVLLEKVWIQLFSFQLQQIVGQTRLFILGMVGKEKENSEFKPVKFRLEINLCHILISRRNDNYLYTNVYLLYDITAVAVYKRAYVSVHHILRIC